MESIFSDDVSFTIREVDVIACLVCSKSVKRIALMLSISPRTVQTHLRNIMFKIGCNSQEGLVDFVEKSGQFLRMRSHYLNLIAKTEFVECLKSIVREKALPRFIIIHEEDDGEYRSFLNRFLKDVKTCGVFIDKKSRREIKSYLEAQTIQSAPIQVVYACPASHISYFQEIGDLFYPKIDTKKTKYTICFFAFEKNKFSKPIFYSNDNIFYSDLIFFQDYYLFFVELIATLTDNDNVQKILSSFKKNYDSSLHSFQGKSPQGHIKKPPQFQEGLLGNLFGIKSFFFNFFQLSKGIKLPFYAVIFSFFLFLFIFLPAKMYTERRFSAKHTLVSEKKKIVHDRSKLHSNIVLPTSNLLLKRQNILSELNKKFSNPKKHIQVVALVGAGGAGKTTLARQYVASQKVSVMWELNAETNERLKSSFESLAQDLSKTDLDQKILRNIQEMEDPERRDNQVVSFVKERLNTYSNWFLIYDNVERFKDIGRYFPQVSQKWGEGKIIITTRNGNIQNNYYVLDTIQIGELTPDQKLTLFTKIMGEGNNDSFSSFRPKETKMFLERLPSFPLDISVSAYYIKATNGSYQIYLEELNHNNKDFKNLHRDILREAGDYSNIRHDIITLSLKHIIGLHKDFGDLLLLVSLLDSHNIPRELLERYKDSTTVSNFIYNLKKHSLIVNESVFFSPIKAFSIHRSTQEVSLAYLIEKLKLEENIHLLQPILDILVKYMVELLNDKDVSKMKFWIPHGEFFLRHNKLLDNTMKKSLRNELGSIYRDLSYFEKAKSIFEENIMTPKKNYNDAHVVRALTGLGEVYRDLGDYEKAKDLLEKSVFIYKTHLYKNYKDRAHALLYLGFVEANLGNYEKAKDLLEESLIIYRNHFPEKYTYGVKNIANLGNVYRTLGNYAGAENVLEQGLVLCRKYLSQDHMDLALTLAYLGVINEEIGHYEKAKNLLEQCFNICKKHFSEDHLMIAQVSMLLGNNYIAMGQYKKSRNLLERSIKSFQKYYPEKHIFNIRALTSLGRAYTKLNDYKTAKNILEKNLEMCVNNLKKNSIDTAQILIALGEVYSLEDRLNAAEDFFLRALNIFKENNNPKMYMAFESLADLFLKKANSEKNRENFIQFQNCKSKAIEYLKQAQETVEKQFPQDSSHMTRIRSKKQAWMKHNR